MSAPRGRRYSGYRALAAAVLAAGAFLASAPAVAAGDDWLMMVVTRATDPAREAEFNAWYDDIDIPDVLEVPGYERARRGHRILADGLPPVPSDEGPYVALYDIDSRSIDRTIIDMLMATRKMEARGRTTDLLQVTERVYYRKRAPGIRGRAPASAKSRYVFVERADCCESPAADARFLKAYDAARTRAAQSASGVVSVRRYELYRVLMIEPKPAPRYLTIYEIDAASEAEAVRVAQSVLAPTPGMSATVAHATFYGSRLFRVLRDVPRSAAAAAPRHIETVTVHAGTYASVNSFIFSNGRELLVMDVLRKPEEARRLVERIRGFGLPLKYILISHGHTDHFTGMAVVKHAFPDARIVVANENIKRAIRQYAEYMDSGGATGGEPALDPSIKPKTPQYPNGFDYDREIEVLDSNRIELPSGGVLELQTDYLPTEADFMTTAYSPDLNALFLADLGYDRVHHWLGDDISYEDIANWQQELKRLKREYASRDPRIYPGHGEPTDMSLFDASVKYLEDYVRITRGAKTRDEAMRGMMALYPDYREANFFLKYSVENHVKAQAR